MPDHGGGNDVEPEPGLARVRAEEEVLADFPTHLKRLGVRFAPLPNLTWPGEDRHFCLRAAALGFDLWADTHLPPLHLYRPDDLDRVADFRASTGDLAEQWLTLAEIRRAALASCTADEVLDAIPSDRRTEHAVVPRANVVAPLTTTDREALYVDVELELERPGGPSVGRLVKQIRVEREPSALTASVRRPRVLLSMLVRNEAERYLRQVLQRVLPLVDEALVLDDGSEDGTPELCERELAPVPHEVVRIASSRFDHEHELRSLQWRKAIAREPDWILVLDADELLEPRAIADLPALLEGFDHDVIAVRLFDMWDPEHFREDALWTAHRRSWPLLVRPLYGPVQWRERDQHCGRWPLEIEQRPWKCTELRVQHLGWMRAEDRAAKHARYLQLDPEGRHGNPAQYASILDASPRLTRWRP